MKIAIYAGSTCPFGEVHLHLYRTAKVFVDQASHVLDMMDPNYSAEDAWDELTPDEQKMRYLARRKKIHAAIEAVRKLIAEYQDNGGFVGPAGPLTEM
jgi:hypothetical protein